LPGAALSALGIRSDGALESVVGVGISHLSHLLSALALHQLGLSLFGDRRLSFVAGLLHVLSPAGLFLSAPYAESTFSLFSFAGMLLFARGCRNPSRDLVGDGAIVASGVIFGLATTMRSNGILNGIPFAAYAVTELLKTAESPSLVGLRRLAALGIGGLSVAIGSIGPQAMAYKLFCSEPSVINARPWCAKLIPSIYNFVQERYWLVLWSALPACIVLDFLGFFFGPASNGRQECWLPALLDSRKYSTVPTRSPHDIPSDTVGVGDADHIPDFCETKRSGENPLEHAITCGGHGRFPVSVGRPCAV
jgi:Gpi18-like mannosyltransferase